MNQKKKLLNTIFILFTAIIGALAQSSELPAFPGAEGHGKYVTGGRGGQVIYVTNLSDDGKEGSLRYAINQSGARIVLFKISGTIQLQSNLKINKDNITIAGQTAPGDGICIRDYPVIVSCNNVIIRFLRFRMGDSAEQENDALGGRFHRNIIVDHCSMSWSTDECVSFYANENFTLQWSIISESLRTSVHEKGSHGYGGVWGGKNASFHHNLLANHDSRNPRLGEYAGDEFALTDLVDLRNNVIYNWQGNSCYGGEAMNVNIVNCYYKPGLATSSSKATRIVSIDKYTKDSTSAIYDTWGHFYIDGNILEGSEEATEDNWTYGVYNQFASKYGTLSSVEKQAIKANLAFDSGEITTHTADEAYERVLDYAGANLVRDTIDKRIIYDVRNGTASIMDGGKGSTNGIIDTQTAVGGWSDLNSTEAPTDTDKDGMPDIWEENYGLNSNSSDDAQQITVDGEYPNLETYINSLVSDIINNQNEDVEEEVITGIDTILQSEIQIFGFKSRISIKGINSVSTVSVFDLKGIVIKVLQINRDTDFAFKPGLYIVRVISKEEAKSAKVIVGR